MKMKGVLVRYTQHDLLYKHYKHLLYSAVIAIALAFISTFWLLHSFQTVPVRVFCTEPCLPQDFPASGNGLWFTSPATWWSTQYLPIGNGHLGAMVSGGTSFEIVQINIESLWSGGPFQDPLYNGGNPPADARTSLAEDMQSIRNTIFSSGTIDNIDVLQEPAGAYGSYAGAGFLTTTVDVSGNVSGYARWLDLDDGIAKATWTQDDQIFNRETYCSEPAQACVQHFYSDFDLPDTTVAFDTSIETGFITPNVTCLDNVPGAIQVRNTAPGATGMLYEILISVEAHPSSAVITCVSQSGGSANATITVSGATDTWITWVGDTDFLQTASNFTFQGPDPHLGLVSTLTQVSDSGQSDPAEHQADLKSQYLQDYHAHVTPLSLSLGPTLDRDEIQPIDVAKAAYLTDVGNPWLEWVLFNYGRYMLVTSARGSLPSNLQGVWADGATNAWSADYHANINTQMNYWAAEMLNLPLNITQSLWDYLQFNWAPRGTYTAQVLYNISEGWVTHNEMNIFGHTGMKLSGNSAQWSDYPESAVWMMIHVWDHFDFSGDVEWWQRQGYPLVKGVASFHLQKLIEDRYFNDSTLVTAPCNSPEQVPITFGCAHAQQVIWQLLNAVEKGFNASGDNDLEFLQTVRDERARMDYGVRIGSWGQLQEWKIDMDSPTDTHRHLSHLIGLYPGYALTHYNPSFQPVKNLSQPEQYLNYTNADVVEASEISLIHRGNGTGPDADAGWEKVWRAAAWAQLGNASEFYHELTYTIERDFAGNLFSVYNPLDPDPLNIFFQIDANLGYPAAVLNALIQAPDVPALNVPLVITLLPALPSQWASQGHLTGVRVRGGITVDLYWQDGRPTSVLFAIDNDDGTRTVVDREVVVMYDGVVVADFVTSPGLKRAVTKFGQAVRFRGQRADY